VPSCLDLVALSILWTEGAHRKPGRRQTASDGDSPALSAAAFRDVLDLEAVLQAVGVSDIPGRADDLRQRAARAIADAATRGIGLVLRGSPDYPDRLAFIPDPPPVLWTRGTVNSCAFAVSVVGSRTATPHGLEVAFRLGEGLARAGLLVVSGLARGVDAAAHRGALRGGGRTIAVLGCGVDVAYPPEHARLALEIAASGAAISEFAPGIPPRGWHFPRRNRIISGVSMGVVIVEASDHSGSLITARCALEQGRSVMAVPGGVLSGRNRGAHGLLRDGARVVEDARDVIEELELDWCQKRKDAENGSDPCSVEPLPQEPILRAMKAGEACGLEELSEQTGLNPVELLARLARLELSGWIQRVEGGQFVKAGGNVLR
jgi:DNA processing protein